jgi:hypothetical protein
LLATISARLAREEQPPSAYGNTGQ